MSLKNACHNEWFRIAHHKNFSRLVEPSREMRTNSLNDRSLGHRLLLRRNLTRRFQALLRLGTQHFDMTSRRGYRYDWSRAPTAEAPAWRISPRAFRRPSNDKMPRRLQILTAMLHRIRAATVCLPHLRLVASPACRTCPAKRAVAVQRPWPSPAGFAIDFIQDDFEGSVGNTAFSVEDRLGQSRCLPGHRAHPSRTRYCQFVY